MREKLLNFTRNPNSQETYQILSTLMICVTFLCLAFGINRPFAMSFQTFFYIAGLLALAPHFKNISKQSLKKHIKILAIPLICAAVITICLIYTYFDPLGKQYSSLIKFVRDIRNSFGLYIEMFLLAYILATLLKIHRIKVIFTIFLICCIITLIGLMRYAFNNGFLNNVPTLYFASAFWMHGMFLLCSVSIGVTGLILSKRTIFRSLWAIFLIISIAGIFAFAERGFILASLAMFFAPLIFLKYKHKVKVIAGFLILISASIFALYQAKDLPYRYNLSLHIPYIKDIISLDPIQMGKYDSACFEKNLSIFEYAQFNKNPLFITCFAESTQDGPAKSFLDHSITSRLAMAKSTLFAILHDPKPHVTNTYDTGAYLYNFFNLHPQWRTHRTYCIGMTPKYEKFNCYQHQHNFWLNNVFMYGIVGFLALIGITLYIFIPALIESRKNLFTSSDACPMFSKKALGMFVMILFSGLFMHGMFDVLLNETLSILFIIMGFSAGLLRRNDF